MKGRSPKCYIFVKIRPPVPEKKIFEGVLPYMGVAAILIGQAVSKEKTYDIVDRRTDDNDGRLTMGIL